MANPKRVRRRERKSQREIEVVRSNGCKFADKGRGTLASFCQSSDVF